jgi:hypothetical protein
MRPDVIVCVGHVDTKFKGNSLIRKVIVSEKFIAFHNLNDLRFLVFRLQTDRLVGRFTHNKTLDRFHLDVLQLVSVKINDRLKFIKDATVTYKSNSEPETVVSFIFC